MFEALFKGMSTQFGRRTIEKCFEYPHFSIKDFNESSSMGCVKVYCKDNGDVMASNREANDLSLCSL